MTDAADKKMHGEGDHEAAKRYTDDKRAFVESGKVGEAAEKAAEQSAEEGRRAREAAIERAKEHDPQETRDHGKPAA